MRPTPFSTPLRPSKESTREGGEAERRPEQDPQEAEEEGEGEGEEEGEVGSGNREDEGGTISGGIERERGEKGMNERFVRNLPGHSLSSTESRQSTLDSGANRGRSPSERREIPSFRLSICAYIYLTHPLALMCPHTPLTDPKPFRAFWQVSDPSGRPSALSGWPSVSFVRSYNPSGRPSDQTSDPSSRPSDPLAGS